MTNICSKSKHAFRNVHVKDRFKPAIGILKKLSPKYFSTKYNK